MKTSLWLRWLLAAIAISALAFFAACGDDDDDDDAGGNGGDSSNNGDDEDDEDSGSGGGGSDEEEYVSDLCGGFSEFGEAFTAILLDPENQDKSEEEALKLFEEPFEALLDAMQDADPPGDVEEFHDALVDNLEESIEKIRDGDIAAFEEVSNVEFPEPSAEVEAKYAALFEENEECVAAGLDFSGE